MKNDENKNGIDCMCTDTTGLFVPNRELSYCVAGGLLGLFFVFMAGFFWGQQHAIKDFLHKLNQDSFADQVASSLYVLTDNPLELTDQETDQEENGDGDDTDSESSEGDEDDGSGDNDGNTEKAENNNDRNSEAIKQLVENNTTVNTTLAATLTGQNNEVATRYYAQLIGFGTAQAADQFVNRITKRGFPAKVEKRTSKTTRGKKVSWYQVVTDVYVDKADLEKVIEIIVWQEKLKDVRIVTC